MNDLRRRMRAQRRALRPAQQRGAAGRLCRALARNAMFLRAQRIAVYVAADGEIDTSLLRKRAWQLGKRIYLPVLHPLRPRQLVFVEYKVGDRLLRNRFGIPEPKAMRAAIPPWRLDLVLMPLVAFDAAGNRLGMGGGFYDRTFSLARQAMWPRKPKLCGVAHQLQQVPALPARVWDVPLKTVFTD
jgi:5-formyltetrahydrofolate cyclo-ligase